MFGALENYKSKDFYGEHKTVCFDTLTKRGEYEIIAVFKTVAYSSAGFRYYDFVDAENEDEFKEREITLSEMKATDIQAFYMKQLKRVKANSVIHYHAVIHRALKYAVKIDLISVNPADKVERPKADKFIGSFYDSN